MITSKNISKEDLYRLTLSSEAKGLKKGGERKYTVDAWAMSESTDANGEIHSITAFMSNGNAYATNSKAVNEKFSKIIEFLKLTEQPDTGFVIECKIATARNGREYPTIELVL